MNNDNIIAYQLSFTFNNRSFWVYSDELVYRIKNSFDDVVISNQKPIPYSNNYKIIATKYLKLQSFS